MEDNIAREKIKKSWVKLLKDSEFPDDKIDKVFEYCQNHMDYELYGRNIKADESTIHLALNVLKKINLDDVEFVKVNDEVRTNVVKFNFIEDSFPNHNLNGDSIMIEEIINMLVEIQQTKKLYIFLLFSEMKQIDGNIMVFNRFYIK